MNQPLNASSLAAMRVNRKVPPLPVLISFVGKLDFTNLTLIADVSEQHNWRTVMGLEVEVFAARRIAFADIVRQLAAIAAVVPKRMVLTFVEGPRIECGESRRIYDDAGDFDLFDWFPMAVGLNAYGPAQIVEKQLWKAIADGDIPTPYDRAVTLVGEILKEKNQ